MLSVSFPYLLFNKSTMKIFLSILLFSFTFISLSQNWNIGNQNCIGGSSYDGIGGSLLLSNGTTLIYGSSMSGISGNKTEANIGGNDIWLVAIDDNLQIIWQKTIGGLLEEYPTKLIETTDHQLLLLSYSNSEIGGMKTAPNYGSFDLWLIKMDLSGNILWDKTYGGSMSDSSADLVELESKNLLISSGSMSGISGNKTSAIIGGVDIWILKIDESGEILMDKTIGGTGNEGYSEFTIVNNSDLFLCSYSDSDISGNKTENSYGQYDFWICKLDTNGNISQDKTIGGSGLDDIPILQLLPNGEMFILGTSDSPISGLKTENGYGSEDCWVLKLDENLNIINQKTIGSNSNDVPKKIKKLSNNKYLIGAQSSSDVNIYKSEPNNGVGTSDIWFFTIDENLTFLEDKTIGSSSGDGLSEIIEVSLFNFVIFGISKGINTSDKTCSGSNTGLSNSPTDFWIFNLNTSLGLTEKENNENLKVFPNPVINTFTINSENEMSSIEITTLDGKIIQRKEENGLSSSMNVENIPSGIYLCKIFLSNGEMSTVRFVKE